ncbi:MAG TPA: lipase secretion chaperone [Methylobacter sp.]
METENVSCKPLAIGWTAMRVHTVTWMTAVTVALVAAVIWSEMSAPEHARAKLVVEPNLFSFVRSLDGARSDGDLKIASGSGLVVDQELRDLFEYYITAVSEKTMAEKRIEIGRELDRKYPPAQANQANQILARYLAYKNELLEIEKSLKPGGSMLESSRARLTAIKQARQRFFTQSESEGMFAADDAREDDIYRKRAASLNPEATARLAELDREDAAWANRIKAYVAERRTLLAMPALPDMDRDVAVQRLRDAAFTPEEQRRLAAYE